MFHDFASEKEILNIRGIAKGRMKSTPLSVQNRHEEYTRLRTSKVIEMVI